MLLFGEASGMLARLEGRIDAWFLDGFAPQKNPDMWDPALLRRIAALTRPGGTAATYTVAGSVRRGLEAAGFHLEKRPGFGRKREMLAARLPEPPDSPASPGIAEKRALIIGGGLAGCSAAEAVASRGYAITLLDKGSGPASGASGNPGAVLLPYFPGASRETGTWSTRTRLYTAAWSYSLHLLEWLEREGAALSWEKCGAAQLPLKDALRERQEKYAALGLPEEVLHPLSLPETETRIGAPLPAALPQACMAFPSAVRVEMASWCRTLLDNAGDRLETRWNQAVEGLERSSGGWRAWGENGATLAEAPVVILAGGIGIRNLDGAGSSPLPSLPLKALRGQMTRIAATTASQRLTGIVHYGGYCLPPQGGSHWLGATFERDASEPEIRLEDDAVNIAEARAALGNAIGEEVLERWAGIRAIAPGRRPILGAAGANWPGLYITAGHGARGALTCPYAGEWIASLLEDAPRENYAT